jgi:23S rRNA (uracil1939-C5)-methyltransferase
MSVKKGQLIELTIDQVAFGGKGITRVEGMAVFVDGTVPGDRVLAQVIKKKKSYAEARVVELLAPSAQRVTPPCTCSGRCGGCKWQFLDYAYQLLYKQQHVRDALEHIALIKDVPVHATIGSEMIYGYRNKMEFSCSNRRWLLPEELGREDVVRGMALGLHVPGTFDKVMDIEACLLQPELGNRILGDVRSHIQSSSLPPYDLRSHEGFWRFLVLRHSVAFDEWMVNLVTSWEALDEVRPLAEALTARYPNVATVVNNISTRVSGVATGEREITLHGPGVILEKIGPFTFELSANSFFQTNTRGAARLYEAVKHYAALTGGETVLDLYCGTGTIAIYLADQAREVIGLEVVEGAVADARRNCARNGIANCRFIAGDVRHTLAQVGVRPEVMVIDPPRSGMHADVVKQVMALGPAKIVYVSCNPATMARDLVLLKEAYEVAEVQPVDMFPHTFHIEAVARLQRKC